MATTRLGIKCNGNHTAPLDTEISNCCSVSVTFMDDGEGDWTLCCKNCYHECEWA